MNTSFVIGCLVCIAVISANVVPPSLQCEKAEQRCSACCAGGNLYTPNYDDDCSTYFQSDGSRLHLRNCSAGLVFDITLCVCNFPAEVRCERKECQSKNGTTTIGSNITIADNITLPNTPEVTTALPVVETTALPIVETTALPIQTTFEPSNDTSAANFTVLN